MSNAQQTSENANGNTPLTAIERLRMTREIEKQRKRAEEAEAKVKATEADCDRLQQELQQSRESETEKANGIANLICDVLVPKRQDTISLFKEIEYTPSSDFTEDAMKRFYPDGDDEVNTARRLTTRSRLTDFGFRPAFLEVANLVYFILYVLRCVYNNLDPTTKRASHETKLHKLFAKLASLFSWFMVDNDTASNAKRLFDYFNKGDFSYLYCDIYTGVLQPDIESRSPKQVVEVIRLNDPNYAAILLNTYEHPLCQACELNKDIFGVIGHYVLTEPKALSDPFIRDLYYGIRTNGYKNGKAKGLSSRDEGHKSTVIKGISARIPRECDCGIRVGTDCKLMYPTLDLSYKAINGFVNMAPSDVKFYIIARKMDPVCQNVKGFNKQKTFYLSHRHRISRELTAEDFVRVELPMTLPSGKHNSLASLEYKDVLSCCSDVFNHLIPLQLVGNRYEYSEVIDPVTNTLSPQAKLEVAGENVAFSTLVYKTSFTSKDKSARAQTFAANMPHGIYAVVTIDGRHPAVFCECFTNGESLHQEFNVHKDPTHLCPHLISYGDVRSTVYSDAPVRLFTESYRPVIKPTSIFADVMPPNKWYDAYTTTLNTETKCLRLSNNGKFFEAECYQQRGVVRLCTICVDPIYQGYSAESALYSAFKTKLSETIPDLIPAAKDVSSRYCSYRSHEIIVFDGLTKQQIRSLMQVTVETLSELSIKFEGECQVALGHLSESIHGKSKVSLDEMLDDLSERLTRRGKYSLDFVQALTRNRFGYNKVDTDPAFMNIRNCRDYRDFYRSTYLNENEVFGIFTKACRILRGMFSQEKLSEMFGDAVVMETGRVEVLESGNEDAVYDEEDEDESEVESVFVKPKEEPECDAYDEEESEEESEDEYEEESEDESEEEY